MKYHEESTIFGIYFLNLRQKLGWFLMRRNKEWKKWQYVKRAKETPRFLIRWMENRLKTLVSCFRFIIVDEWLELELSGCRTGYPGRTLLLGCRLSGCLKCLRRSRLSRVYQRLEIFSGTRSNHAATKCSISTYREQSRLARQPFQRYYQPASPDSPWIGGDCSDQAEESK